MIFLARFLARLLLKVMRSPPIEIILWDGSCINAKPDREIKVYFKTKASFFKTIFLRDVGFGDGYCAGDITVIGNFRTFLRLTYNKEKPDSFLAGLLYRVHNLLKRKPKTSTQSRAKGNIHRHYDLGNDFYSSWLDAPYMQYTCAYFKDTTLSLEQAQIAKMEHICRKLELKPKQTVVEAGCGWGGLALYMAQKYDVRVISYNISVEQIDYARKRANEEKLEHKVKYVLDDYRNITGEFDAFVSVGMLEHVGLSHYRSLGATIDGVLKPNGRILIHSIGRNRPSLMNSWIEKNIFPGAYPPALSEMTQIFEPFHLSVLDVENLRLHYSLTLQHWHERFYKNLDTIIKKYNESFARAWELYLLGSIEAFETGSLQLFQVQLAREKDNSIPYNRLALYR